MRKTALPFFQFLLFCTLFLSISTAHAACSLNEDGVAGVAGEIEYFDGPQAVRFDGTDRIDLTGASGLTDTKFATGSFWFRLDPTYSAVRAIFTMNNRFFVQFNSATDNDLIVRVNDPPGTGIYLQNRYRLGAGNTDWNHFMFAIDMNDLSNHRYYLNGQKIDMINMNYSNQNISLDGFGLGIGTFASGGNIFDGDLADIWVQTGTYIDLDIEENRRKFITADGEAVYLGQNGEFVNGTIPDFFMSGPVDDWHTNRGTLTGMTLTGTLEASTSSPPGYGVFRFCDGTDWIDMAITEASDPDLGSGSMNSGSGSGGSGGGTIDDGYFATGVHFENVSDTNYLEEENLPLTDSKRVSGSLWFRAYDTPDGQDILFSSQGTFWVSINNGRIFFRGAEEGGGTDDILRIQTTTVGEWDDGQWHHLVFAIDMDEACDDGDVGDPGCLVYINGVPQAMEYATVSGGSPFTSGGIIDFGFNATSVSDIGIGAFHSGANAYDGYLADLWVDFGNYIDFSDSTELAKFRQEALPVFLGNDGSLPTGSQPEIFMSGARSSWHTNKGSIGGFTKVGDLGEGGVVSEFAPLTVSFDGSTELQDNTGGGSAFTSDERSVSGSFWIKRDSADITTGSVIIDNDGGRFRVNFDDPGNTIQIRGFNPSGTLLFVLTSDYVIDNTNWHHVLFSIDLSNGNAGTNCPTGGINSAISPACQIWVNDQATNVTRTNAYPNNLIDLGGRIVTIMGGSAAGNFVTGDIAEVWIDGGTFIDFSNESNRRKFINDRGMPIFLGATGTLPTGSTPDIFLSDNNIGSWDENKGAGDGFNDADATGTGAGQVPPGEPISPVSNPSSNLLAHWRLDETTGADIDDASFNNNDGTWDDNDNNSVVEETVAGKVGTAITFDGVDDEISGTSNFSDLRRMTVAAWIYPTDAPHGDNFERVFHKGGRDSGFPSFIYRPNNQNMRLEYAWTSLGAWGMSVDDLVPLNQWTHVAVTYDANDTGNDPIMYVNGSPVAITEISTPTGSVLTDNNNYYIGVRHDSSRHFEGRIDDLRVYDDVLTAEEIQEIYLGASSGLIAHWPLDETTGSTIEDITIVGNDGTWEDDDNNDVGEEDVPGVIGTALNFDGSNDSIRTASNNPAYNQVPLSISLWFYPDGASGTIITNRNLGGGNFRNWRITYDTANNRNIFSTVQTDGSFRQVRADNNSVTENEWNHVVGVIDQTNAMKIYVNGVLQSDTDTLPLGLLAANLELRIGEEDNNEFFDGRIDDIRIYNKELTAQEIGQLFYRSETGLIGHWRLDETSGTTATDSVAGNNGTMQFGLNAGSDSIPGKLGTALDFDGDDDIIVDDVTYPLEEVTVCAWGYVNSGENRGSLFSYILSGDNVWALEYYDDDSDNVGRWAIRHEYASGGENYDQSTGAIINTGEWNHLCAGINASKRVFLYLNGELTTSTFQPATAWWRELGDARFKIGGRSTTSGDPLDGRIDDVRIYNRVLSQSEVQSLMSRSLISAGSCSEPRSMFFDNTNNTMQWCGSASDLYNMSEEANRTGTSCTGEDGSLRFNDTDDWYEYCDGTEWVSIGKSP